MKRSTCLHSLGNVPEQNKVIRKMPGTNRKILQILLSFLSRVASKSDVNRMTNAELSALFGPVILGYFI